MIPYLKHISILTCLFYLTACSNDNTQTDPPIISVINPEIQNGILHPEVGEEFTILLSLSAEASLGDLYANNSLITTFENSKNSLEYSYSFIPENKNPYYLEIYITDTKDEQSNKLTILIVPTHKSETTFSVDMTSIDISNGVYLWGDFSETPIPMATEGNNIYTYTTLMDVGTQGDYFFLNGLGLLQGWYYTEREEIPVRCGTSITPISRNRSFTIGETNATIHNVWGTCSDSGNNERVLFFGNSITALGNYEKGYIALIDEMLTNDGVIKDLIGVGISGQRVADLKERVQRDIVASNPSTVVIYIGINDVWFGNGDADVYKSDYNDLINTIKTTGAKIILATPTVIGELKNKQNTFDARLDLFSEKVRELADEQNLELVDLRQIFVDYIATNNSNNVSQGLLTSDSVHMTDLGNQLIADSLKSYLLN